jgi:beta-galactosidase
LKAVSRKNGKVVLEKEIHTAGKAATLELISDKKVIKKDGYDLTYITVSAKDMDGNLVPDANHLIQFEISGGGKIVGVDNGYQANLDSFKASSCTLYNGKCIVIVQSNTKKETIKLTASSEKGIQTSAIEIKVE